MTLWNIIRDFFVQYIFGGTMSNGNYVLDNVVGNLAGFDNGLLDERYVAGVGDIYVLSFEGESNYLYKLTLGDWLSTTATIIVLCAICVFLFFFVRWLFRLTAGLVSGRG